jgi:Predicted glycosyltransferases
VQLIYLENMNKNVAAIVVTYNRISLLKECIESIRIQSYKDFTIIVVNNGSTDETAEWLNQQSDLVVITQVNSGGAGGFYSGIKYACEHGFAYSWIMDDDVIANTDALQNLMKYSNDIKGFLCSHVLDINGAPCNVPKISTIKSGVTDELLWGEKLIDNLLRVDVTSFVSLFFRNSIVYEIGLPYKEYFIWGDDTEYTTRISSLYPSYIALGSIVIHKRKIQSALSILKETDKNRIRNYFYAYRNRIHNQKTFQRKLLMFLYALYEALYLLVRGKFYHAYIIMKGLLCSLSFSPKIQYPNNA